MGQILDIVPNHMGVMGADNALVAGRAGERPRLGLRRLLRHRLAPAAPSTSPTACCCRCWATTTAPCSTPASSSSSSSRRRGAFAVRYFEHRLPIDPSAVPAHPRAGRARARGRGRRGDAQRAVAALAAEAFAHLPPARRDRRARASTSATATRRSPRDASRAWRVRAPRWARPSRRGGAAERPRPATRRASTRCTSCSSARRTASPTGAWRRTRSTTAASSTSTSSPRCAWRTRRCSTATHRARRLAGARGRGGRRCASTIRTGSTTRASTSAASRRPAARADLRRRREDRWRPRDAAARTGPVHGTTGYRFANVVNGLFVDTAAEVAHHAHLSRASSAMPRRFQRGRATREAR